MDLQLTFHEIEPTDALRAYVEKHARKLTTFHDRIESCRVALEEPHRHHHQGRQFRVSIAMHVPGKELAVSHDPSYDHDLYAAIDRAFDSAVRVLQDDKARFAPTAQTIRGR